MTEPDFDFCARERRFAEFQARRDRLRWWVVMASVAATALAMLYVRSKFPAGGSTGRPSDHGDSRESVLTRTDKP